MESGTLEARAKGCHSKKQYTTRGQALSAARVTGEKFGINLGVYACFVCMQYHLTRHSSGFRRAWRHPPGYGDHAPWELTREQVGCAGTVGVSIVERIERARWILSGPSETPPDADEQQGEKERRDRH